MVAILYCFRGVDQSPVPSGLRTVTWHPYRIWFAICFRVAGQAGLFLNLPQTGHRVPVPCQSAMPAFASVCNFSFNGGSGFFCLLMRDFTAITIAEIPDVVWSEEEPESLLVNESEVSVPFRIRRFHHGNWLGRFSSFLPRPGFCFSNGDFVIFSAGAG